MKKEPHIYMHQKTEHSKYFYLLKKNLSFLISGKGNRMHEDCLRILKLLRKSCKDINQGITMH